jgi:hypothetical protein
MAGFQMSTEDRTGAASRNIPNKTSHFPECELSVSGSGESFRTVLRDPSAANLSAFSVSLESAATRLTRPAPSGSVFEFHARVYSKRDAAQIRSKLRSNTSISCAYHGGRRKAGLFAPRVRERAWRSFGLLAVE